MIETPISHHLDAVRAAARPFIEFLGNSKWTKRLGDKSISDFVVGNPHEMPLPEYVDAIRRASIPRHPGWFGYKTNDPHACEVAARSLVDRLDIPFESEDIFLTKGASSALVVALSTVLNPGDEVIFQSPPWFFYEAMIAFARGTAIRVSVDLGTFDLDVESIAAAISPRTRAVIVNSPNNPTGRIYPAQTLKRLGQVLTSASEKQGRAIYLLSDESYNRIVFDGRRFTSPIAHYANSVLIYSYAKALLTPGQRLGYLALGPFMPRREQLRAAIFATQCSGYGFPDAVLQHALPDLEPLCIDMTQLQRRRDTMVEKLRELDYDVHVPDGAWYLLVRSPIPDDAAFVDMLAAEDVFVLPGSIVELPGYFRISLTASDEMITRSVRGFGSAIEAARGLPQFSISSPDSVAMQA